MIGFFAFVLLHLRSVRGLSLADCGSNGGFAAGATSRDHSSDSSAIGCNLDARLGHTLCDGARPALSAVGLDHVSDADRADGPDGDANDGGPACGSSTMRLFMTPCAGAGRSKPKILGSQSWRGANRGSVESEGGVGDRRCGACGGAGCGAGSVLGGADDRDGPAMGAVDHASMSVDDAGALVD